jgi:hypothetical protein
MKRREPADRRPPNNIARRDDNTSAGRAWPDVSDDQCPLGMVAGLYWALRTPMPNGRYCGVPIGLILLQHDNAAYIEYLAFQRRDERCGLAARIILRELFGAAPPEFEIDVGLDEALHAEAAGFEWRRAA